MIVLKPMLSFILTFYVLRKISKVHHRISIGSLHRFTALRQRVRGKKGSTVGRETVLVQSRLYDALKMDAVCEIIESFPVHTFLYLTTITVLVFP